VCTKPYFKGKILWLKCTKFDFGWGSAPDPAEGAYSAPPGPPDPLSEFKGSTSKGKGKGKEKSEEGKGRGKGQRRCIQVLRGRESPTTNYYASPSSTVCV